jgi:hypothetical protein
LGNEGSNPVIGRHIADRQQFNKLRVTGGAGSRVSISVTTIRRTDRGRVS